MPKCFLVIQKFSEFDEHNLVTKREDDAKHDLFQLGVSHENNDKLGEHYSSLHVDQRITGMLTVKAVIDKDIPVNG